MATGEGTHPCLSPAVSPALPLLSRTVYNGREMACSIGLIYVYPCQDSQHRDSCCSHPLWYWLLTPLLPTVSLKWRLHFEFVTSGESAGTCLVRGNQSEAITWTGVEQMEVDTFSWDLPIKVLPTNPILASYVSQFSSTNSITI